MNNKKMVLLLCLSLLTGVSYLYSSVKRATTVKRFDREVKKSKLAIVMFYVEDRQTRKNKPLRQKIKGLHKLFRQASKDEEDIVRFLSVNVGKKKLSALLDRYSADMNRRPGKALGCSLGSIMDDKRPVFLLFKDGSIKAFKGEDGKVVCMSGFPSVQQIRNFISDAFQDYIDEIIKRKVKRERRRAERRARSWYYGPGFYAGWGYPYYYPYYHYPYHSYGWGFGW